MEALAILVGEVFNHKDTYREGDYLVIMNILKEAYHVLKKDDRMKKKEEKEVDSEGSDSDDDEDDHYNEDEDNPTYTGTYIQSY